MRKELWFGFSLMAILISGCAWMLLQAPTITNGHIGLLMLGLVVVAIMLGFPTAFTLMGMGMMFGWFALGFDTRQVLDLMVQRTYSVMTNDVLIAIPLFVFMGYLVERANLIEALFKGLHLATARIPGALAVATIITCAIFATATGIVGAVVTVMGLLAFPAMIKAGYNVKVAAGAITAGGCLGVLIPPSVLLIVYAATAGVSVVQLYAGAFLPGFMLAALYIGYVIILAKWKPELMPPLAIEARKVALPPLAELVTRRSGQRAFTGLFGALKDRSNIGAPIKAILGQLTITLLPALVFLLCMGLAYTVVTAPAVVDTIFVEAADMARDGAAEDEAEDTGETKELEVEKGGALELPAEKDAATEKIELKTGETSVHAADAEREPAPLAFWIVLGVGATVLVLFYWIFNFTRLEIFKMLLRSFFPLAFLILAVLGSIVAGLATPTEAAAVGAVGGMLLAAAYGRLKLSVVRESLHLTAKTTAMVCWLFIGSSVFAASFALLGGQEIVEQWVLSLGLTSVQFMILAQAIIFLLGWPLEWTEIIVIFMPIFIPLLPAFNVDPLFFGLLVALNLQTAYLSPPVAMAAFYLKGVAPKHVTLNQIFAGMLPFMGIQLIALLVLYTFPSIGLWLPSLLYAR
jgi:TRAP-type mannitol/chloroaromatic compound transport system permease large subunit